MVAILVVAAREVAGPTLGYVVIALLGVVLLSAVLPPGSLQTTMEHKNPYAPLAMTAVAIPAYATPLVAMSQLGSMFQHANSVGAAFVLLTLGAGINLGLIAWVVRNYGPLRALSWMTILLAVVLSIAYAIENPLYPSEIQPPGHTHAFDMYCRPYSGGETHLVPAVFAKLKEDLQPFERVGLTVMGFLVVTGLALRTLDRRWRIEDWLERSPELHSYPGSRFDVVVPAPVLGALALVGAGRPLRRRLLCLLPDKRRGLQGNVHPPRRGFDRGDERESETRNSLHPDLGRLDAQARGGGVSPRVGAIPLPPHQGQGLSRPARASEARRRRGRPGRNQGVRLVRGQSIRPHAPGLSRCARVDAQPVMPRRFFRSKGLWFIHSSQSFRILLFLGEVKMPSRTWLCRRIVLGGSLALILTGCGGHPEIKAIPTDERGLTELARLYRDFASQKKRGPNTLKELNVKGQQYPIAVQMIKSGDLVLQRGTALVREGETPAAVLAYVKTVPEGTKGLDTHCNCGPTGTTWSASPTQREDCAQPVTRSPDQGRATNDKSVGNGPDRW